MSTQSRAYNDWQDRIAAGVKPTVENFARSALTDLPRVETGIRKPNFSAWPPEVQAEMEAIWKGEGQ